MPSPVRPSDFAATVPGQSSDFCTKFKLVFLTLPNFLASFMAWMLGSDGSISDAFKAEVNPFSAGDLKVTFSALTPTGWLRCLAGDSMVRLTDGSTKTIKEIVDDRLDVEVISFNESTGNLEPAKVVGWNKATANADEWIRLRIRRGGGGGPRHIDLTKDHRVLTQRGWMEAGSLLGSDVVYRLQETLSDIGFRAALGIYLGDGTVDKSRFSTCHSVGQLDYCKFSADKFGARFYTREPNISKLCSSAADICGFRFSMKTFHPKLQGLCKRGFEHLIKILPELTPISLAFWYMDDGNLMKDKRYPDYFRARLCTEGFSDEEGDAIVDYFTNKWGIKAKLYRCSGRNGRTMIMDDLGSETFFGLVSSYIHPSMRYKLPERFRDVPFLLEQADFITEGMVEYRPELRHDRPHDTGWSKNHTHKYDITVEGNHNFFANGLLVHNCEGQSVNRVTYAALFTAIGTTYGAGDGTTTFNLPDCRNRVTLGVSGTKALGSVGGEETHVLTVAEMPAHTHPIQYQQFFFKTDVTTLGVANFNPVSSSSTGSTGGGAAHNNLPPYVAVYFLIKT
jgi:microcystin-dependent protein